MLQNSDDKGGALGSVMLEHDVPLLPTLKNAEVLPHYHSAHRLY